MKHTLKEKLEYNAGRRTPFSIGYIYGYKLYCVYPEASRERKREIMGDIDDNKRIAQSGNPARGVS